MRGWGCDGTGTGTGGGVNLSGAIPLFGTRSMERFTVDTCPTREGDPVFWREVRRQAREACGFEEGEGAALVLEITCEEVGDVYVFRARVRCIGPRG